MSKNLNKKGTLQRGGGPGVTTDGPRRTRPCAPQLLAKEKIKEKFQKLGKNYQSDGGPVRGGTIRGENSLLALESKNQPTL